MHYLVNSQLGKGCYTARGLERGKAKYQHREPARLAIGAQLAENANCPLGGIRTPGGGARLQFVEATSDLSKVQNVAALLQLGSLATAELSISAPPWRKAI